MLCGCLWMLTVTELFRWVRKEFIVTIDITSNKVYICIMRCNHNSYN